MKKVLVILLALVLAINVGCSKKETEKKPTMNAEKKLTQMGARDVKALKTNSPSYDSMEIDERGKAYSVELFEGRKISIETNFKGEVYLLAPDGIQIAKISENNKLYLPAKDGKYYIWFKNNAIPGKYYIIVKTYNTALFNGDADEMPGTRIEEDGVITGVVDSITDPADYYQFAVNANTDLKIYYENSDIDVTILNKYNEETKTETNKPAGLFILDQQELYLKVTAKKGKTGIPYEINLKRSKAQ